GKTSVIGGPPSFQDGAPYKVGLSHKKRGTHLMWLWCNTPMTEDLHSMHDDMVAFIEGHGLRRFGALVDEELPSVLWSDDKPDAWKDVVELAKASNAAFVTLHSITLKKEDLDYLVERLRNGQYPNDDY